MNLLTEIPWYSVAFGSMGLPKITFLVNLFLVIIHMVMIRYLMVTWNTIGQVLWSLITMILNKFVTDLDLVIKLIKLKFTILRLILHSKMLNYFSYQDLDWIKHYLRLVDLDNYQMLTLFKCHHKPTQILLE